ncbi:MAG: EAL domain-containing protein, partial [Deltaproteobacteria bacterium]|nr:EAL domain-containing protein [Deltaproteobacteria bacterium]
SSMLVELDHLCLERAVEKARGLPANQYLFVNVSARTLIEPRMPIRTLVNKAQAVRIPLDHIVLELSEWSESNDLAHLGEVMAELRGLGLKLALDDVGAGNATFAPVEGIMPDFVKIDRTICSGIAAVPIRLRIFSAIVDTARDVGAVPIAEGIEVREDLDVLGDLGVNLVQGFFFSRPGPAFPEVDVATISWPGGAIQQIDNLIAAAPNGGGRG